jgi:hypothetical protein
VYDHLEFGTFEQAVQWSIHVFNKHILSFICKKDFFPIVMFLSVLLHLKIKKNLPAIKGGGKRQRRESNKIHPCFRTELDYHNVTY